MYMECRVEKLGNENVFNNTRDVQHISMPAFIARTLIDGSSSRIISFEFLASLIQLLEEGLLDWHHLLEQPNALLRWAPLLLHLEPEPSLDLSRLWSFRHRRALTHGCQHCIEELIRSFSKSLQACFLVALILKRAISHLDEALAHVPASLRPGRDPGVQDLKP